MDTFGKPTLPLQTCAIRQSVASLAQAKQHFKLKNTPRIILGFFITNRPHHQNHPTHHH